jgi:hypothetical protein
LSKLRRAAKTVVTAEDLSAARLDAETLLRAGVIERRRGSRWRPPGCERHCVPNLDLDTRSEEGLVGAAFAAGRIACPSSCSRGKTGSACDLSRPGGKERHRALAAQQLIDGDHAG